MKNALLKIWNWYQAVNKLWFTVIGSTVLLVLSTFWAPFIYFLVVFAAVNIVFMDYGKAIALNLYFLAYTAFLITYIAIPLCTFVIFVVKYVIALTKKTRKLYLWPLVITAAICLVFSLIYYNFTNEGAQPADYGILQGVMIVGVSFMLYLAFAYRDTIRCSEIFRALIYGVIGSAVLGGLLSFVPFANVFSWDEWKFTYTTVKDWLIFPHSDKYRRFQFLSFHPNHLYVLAVMGIGYIVYWMLHKGHKSVKDIVLNSVEFVALAVVGFLTMSKGFLISFAIVVLFAMVMAVVLYKRKSLYFVLPVVAVAAVVVGIFHEFFILLFSRFFTEGDGDMISAITTGRAAIWKRFLQETFSTPWKAMFGVGLFSNDVINIGPHSLYIAIIYHYGIVGILALGVLVYFYIRSYGKRLQTTALQLCPLVVFLVVALQEACLDERLFFLVACICMAFGKDELALSGEDATQTPLTEQGADVQPNGAAEQPLEAAQHDVVEESSADVVASQPPQQ